MMHNSTLSEIYPNSSAGFELATPPVEFVMAARGMALLTPRAARRTVFLGHDANICLVVDGVFIVALELVSHCACAPSPTAP